MSRFKNRKANVPKARIQDYIWTIYGRPKAGKTTLFHKLIQKAFGDSSKGQLLAFEKGYQALSGVFAEDVPNWKEFISIVDDLIALRADEREEAKKAGVEFEPSIEFIGIDTVDEMWVMATEYALLLKSREDGKRYKTISDIPWGGGYDLVAKTVDTQIKRLQRAGYGLWFITHDKDKKFESRDGVSYDKTTVNLQNRARDLIINMSDFIIFIDIAKEQIGDELVDTRYIYFRGDGELEAGSRFENIESRIPYNVDLFYDVFEKAVLNSVGSGVDIQKLREEQAAVREAEAEAYLEQEQEQASLDDLRDLITEAINSLNPSAKDQVKAKFKELIGTVNYKKEDLTAKQLQDCLDFVRSL